MEIVMFRKTLAAALTVAIIAGSVIAAPTTASAKGGRSSLGLAAAVVGGIATAVIASSVANGHQEDGYRGRYASDDCFEKQITHSNSYGERVVAYKTICR
jgi:hypothetical protein